MKNTSTEGQARSYVFDLMNEAKGHGFKADEEWQLSMSTEAEKTIICRDYYPFVADKVAPDVLLDVFKAIKTALNQPLSKEEAEISHQNVLTNGFKFIVAVNPKRIRK